MQRWWYLDNKTKTYERPDQRRVPSKSIEANDGGERKWLFRVMVTEKLSVFESICVTGECSALGNWIPQHCVFLHRENGKAKFCVELIWFFGGLLYYNFMRLNCENSFVS